jgi:xylulokinase
MSDHLAAIDIGTTGVRAAVVDAYGHVLADASAPLTPQHPEPRWAEADAEAWWGAACTLLRRIGAEQSLTGIAAVGVTGQAPTALLVDGRGRPLRPAVLWLDLRAQAEARALQDALGDGAAEALGGNRLHPYYLGPKLAWLRAHEPQILDASSLVLQSHAFIVQRLTGRAVCDLSTAMLCAPLFDARLATWSAEAARVVGIAPSALPPVVRAHDVVGGVTREAAEATGLVAGTPVVAGGGDFAAAALGAGVVSEGQACLMLGTAGNLLLPMQTPRFDARLINSHHVGCDAWLALAGTLCGGALEWFRSAFGGGVSWELLEREAARVPVGARGLVALPYLQGERTPIWDETARGAFFGVDLTHGRGELYRAMIEAVALGFRHGLAIAQEHGLVVEEVVAVNGAGRSPLLRQALCDALGVPVRWTSGGAGTVTGAAALAGLGIGLLRDASETRAWYDALPNHARHTPDPGAHEALQRVFARRQALYDAVRGL